MLSTARITAETGSGSASEYDDSVSFTADPANADALGVYRNVVGLNSTVDTLVQASYNQIWNRFATSTTVARNPSFSLATNHYKHRDKKIHKASAYTAFASYATAVIVLKF